jgi:Uma2 family endonuclease
MAFAATARLAPPPPEKRDIYPFTVDDYHQLIIAGNLTREDRIELIHGELTLTPAATSSHSSHTSLIIDTLSHRVPCSCLLQIHEPITIPNHSEPQPDAAVVKARPDHYRHAHPQPKDVLLVIEVADTSVSFDANVKSRLYGKAGIPEFWLVDVKERCIRVFTDPSPRGYRTVREFSGKDRVKCGTVHGLTVRVSELLV